MAGQYLGAGKEDEARAVSGQLIWFFGLVSIGIMALIYLIRKFLLTVVFGAITPEVYRRADSYLLIVALSIPELAVYESGAAAATVISRAAAAVVIICLLMQKKRTLYLEKTLHYKPDGRQIKRILSIGVPNGIENGLFQVGKIILASLVAGFGTSAITANAICQTVARSR